MWNLIEEGCKKYSQSVFWQNHMAALYLNKQYWIFQNWKGTVHSKQKVFENRLFPPQIGLTVFFSFKVIKFCVVVPCIWDLIILLDFLFISRTHYFWRLVIFAFIRVFSHLFLLWCNLTFNIILVSGVQQSELTFVNLVKWSP